MSPINNLTQEQIAGIQIDYGIVFVNYGEPTQRKLGPTRGGAEFTVTKNIRQIEYDGGLGRTRGMQVIDEIDAVIKTSVMDISQETLALMMPQADLVAGVITNNTGGLISSSKYLTNVTMFAKTVGGDYKRITLFRGMAESDFTFSAAPKAEGLVALEFYAHWDATNQDSPLYKIENVGSIEADIVLPTATTVPADEATGVVRTSNLTATFSEAIREADINLNNFILIRSANGVVVAGVLTYVPATRIATFDPTPTLDATTPYIWVISSVRDLAGNTMNPIVVNFTTAA